MSPPARPGRAPPVPGPDPRFHAEPPPLRSPAVAVPRMPKGVGSLAGHATVLLLGFVAVGLYDAFTIKLGGTGIRAYVDLPGTGLLRSLFGLLHVEEEVDALAGAGGFH